MTSRFMLAGSPLFLTEFDKPFYFPEVQFILSDKLNFIFERFFETECGVWLINTLAVYTLMRMFFYYFWWQPSALNHFKDKYGQTWNVGHHLYGTDAPNPLKKETKGVGRNPRPAAGGGNDDSTPFDMAYYLEEGLAREVRLDLTRPLPDTCDNDHGYHHFKVIRNGSSFVLESEDTGDFLAYCHVDIFKCGLVDGDGSDDAARLQDQQLPRRRRHRRMVRAKFYFYNTDDSLFSIDKPALVMISSNDASQWTILSSQCDACRYRCKSGGICCSDILITSDILNRASLLLLDNPIKYYTIDDGSDNNDYDITSSSLLRRSSTFVNGIRLSSQQLGCITQDSKCVGRGIYNSIKLAIPNVNDPIWCPLRGDQHKLALRPDGSNGIVLSSIQPEWNNHMNCLILDFNNRIIIPSAKNFQLSLSDSTDIICQFGKIGNDAYALDVKYPLSVMQAFATAISTVLWN
ncbi:hypothetical protein FOL47_005785 [Perkinsus chesapeaki]|uniref:Tubby C-terminal domain-containing protein n=1 Tax=Perkinsus chesapeaki TaxID=330153 RepID=A0A7J6MYB9_PERCH|nr:hypothetical protein FOL47_005785 [Perkinsus chesapeaki]